MVLSGRGSTCRHASYLRMIMSQSLDPAREDLIVQDPRLLEPALLEQDRGDVGGRAEGTGVVPAQRPLPDGEGCRMHALGLVKPPLFPQRHRQAVQRLRHVEVVRPQQRNTELQGLAVQGRGLLQATLWRRTT
jgi:hypothetical protein